MMFLVVAADPVFSSFFPNRHDADKAMVSLCVYQRKTAQG